MKAIHQNATVGLTAKIFDFFSSKWCSMTAHESMFFLCTVEQWPIWCDLVQSKSPCHLFHICSVVFLMRIHFYSFGIYRAFVHAINKYRIWNNANWLLRVFYVLIVLFLSTSTFIHCQLNFSVDKNHPLCDCNRTPLFRCLFISKCMASFGKMHFGFHIQNGHWPWNN